MLALQPGLMLAGRYRLMDRLGVGGMSEAWRGHDEVLGRPVAVKVLSESLLADVASRDLLRREARAMAQLSHPNVTSVFDYGEFTIGDVSLPFVVMELLHGHTLARALVDGPLPWAQAVRVAAQVAAALSAAHRHGLVHCDVTPANVMLTDGGVKMLDFGVAAVLGARHADGRPRFGTPGYIAPECLSAGAPVTPAADMYALGVLLCAALTGHRPGGEQAQMSAADDARAQLAAVPGLPPEVADLCLRCLAVQPADRPDSAEAARVLAAVPGIDIAAMPQAIDAGRPPRTLPMPTAALATAAQAARAASDPFAAHATSRWRRRSLVAAAAGLVLVAVAAYVLSAGDPPRHEVGPQAPATLPVTPTAAAARSQPAVTQAPTGRGTLAAVANLRQLVVNGRAAGEIRAQCAEDLLSRIADLQRRIDRGDGDNARQRIEQIGEEIDDRAAEGDVTAQRAATLRLALAAVVI